MRRIFIISMVSGIIAFACPAACFSGEGSPEPFRLSLKRDAVLIFSGMASQQAGNYILSEMSPPDPAGLNRNDINPLDRFAADYYSKKFSDYSDNTKDSIRILFGLTLLPYLNDFSGDSMRSLLTDAVMFIEAETLIYGITKCAKGLSERPRPYVYNQDVSAEKRHDSISYESFWSGHTSLAFTAAVFTGYVYQRRHPHSPHVKPVWIAGLSCAAATAVLRVRSGNHFPSDVAAAAAAGSLIGWIVPRMHGIKDGSAVLTTSVAGTSGLGVLYRF